MIRLRRYLPPLASSASWWWKLLLPAQVVIASNSTAILDRVADLMRLHGWPCLRLDGSTPESARSVLVEKFNNDSNIKAFLLSSKAGGTGLNLTGASRLFHFDPDWYVRHFNCPLSRGIHSPLVRNPANDQQVRRVTGAPRYRRTSRFP